MFREKYQEKYPKVAERLTKDDDELLAFYDFPVEHRAHMAAMELMVLKMIKEGEKTWL